MMITPELKVKAACKGFETAIFFADFGPMSNKTVKANVSKAKAICKSCDIQVECLMNAINNNEEYGIWGGFTGKERTKMFPEIGKIDYDSALEAVLWMRSI